MTLEIAHIRKMNNLAKRMSDYVARVGGFKNMNLDQEAYHNRLAAEWDKMKADRDMSKQVDDGEMTLDEFNGRKLSNYFG